MIVDSPGVGETSDMEKTVLNYVANAAAFIYIIDSTNAGGMQERVKILEYSNNLSLKHLPNLSKIHSNDLHKVWT